MVYLADSNTGSIISILYISIYYVVHCQWSNWSNGRCTKSCGGGIRNKTRTEKVLAANGGNRCDGPRLVEERCNTENCEGITFYFDIFHSKTT